MATRKKAVKEEVITEEPVITEEIKKEEPVIITEEIKKEIKKEIKPKYEIGSIVFVSKDADADLNGFKLFAQYKKYTYTVEAYDEKSEVYSLRRLNLVLKLKEADIVAPHEKSDDPLIRRQF